MTSRTLGKGALRLHRVIWLSKTSLKNCYVSHEEFVSERSWRPGHPLAPFSLQNGELTIPVPGMASRAGGAPRLSPAVSGSAVWSEHVPGHFHDLLQDLSNCVWSKPFSNGLPLSNTHLSCFVGENTTERLVTVCVKQHSLLISSQTF